MSIILLTKTASQNVEKFEPELKLSVSKIKTFDTCRKKFHYQYIEKLPKKDWSFTVLGSFVHDILEHFHLTLRDDPKAAWNLTMKDGWKKAWEEWGKKLADGAKDEAKEILTNYLVKLAKEQEDGKLAKTVSCEEEINLVIDNRILLNGYIDHYKIDSDGIHHVEDYKTSKHKKYLAKDFFQLETYCVYLFLLHPELDLVKASYVMLRHGSERITKEFKRKDVLKKMEKHFLEKAKEIMSEKLYRASPSKLCEYCEGLEAGCKEGTEFTKGQTKFW